jgi:hypothetical protein
VRWPQQGDGLLTAVAAAARDDGRGAFLGHETGGLKADAGSSAGDQSGVIRQFHSFS